MSRASSLRAAPASGPGYQRATTARTPAGVVPGERQSPLRAGGFPQVQQATCVIWGDLYRFIHKTQAGRG